MREVAKIVPFLLERLREERLAFFVGAGVPGTEAGLPRGQHLREMMLQELGDASTTETLPEIALRFEKDRDRIQLFDFLRGALRLSDDRGRKTLCPSYEIICDLPVDVVLTTNFDNLFEMVSARKGDPFRVYRTDKQLADYPPKGRKLLKVHGDFETAADEIVITKDDYTSYLKRFPQFSHRIKDIFHTRTVVFLGYRLADPNLNHIYDDVLTEAGTLKMKSYAVLDNDPGPEVRQWWLERKVEVIVYSAQAFLAQLQAAHHKESATLLPAGEKVKLYHSEPQRRPTFFSPLSRSAVRKSFAYFLARQKALLRTEAYAFCTVDPMQTTAEAFNPDRTLGQQVRRKAGDIAMKLRAKGYYPEVLPPLELLPEKRRRQKIEEANFCVILVSSRSYEGNLNKFYGSVAAKKPLLLFVHENLRGRLEDDLVFGGLVQVGCRVELFKKKQLTSCELWSRLHWLMERDSDQWILRTLGL